MKKTKKKNFYKKKKNTIKHKIQKGGAKSSIIPVLKNKELIEDKLIKFFWFKTYDIIENENNKLEFIKFIEYLINDIKKNRGGTVFHSTNDELNGLVFVILKICLEKNITKISDFKYNSEDDKLDMITFIENSVMYSQLRRANMINSSKIYNYIFLIFNLDKPSIINIQKYEANLTFIKTQENTTIPIYKNCTDKDYNKHINYPYNLTRVKINDSDINCVNYINANIITKGIQMNLDVYYNNENNTLFNGDYIESSCPLDKTKDTFVQMFDKFNVKRIIMLDDNVLNISSCLVSPSDYTNFFGSWAENEILDTYEKNITNQFHIFLFGLGLKPNLIFDINYDINKTNKELLDIHIKKEEKLEMQRQASILERERRERAEKGNQGKQKTGQEQKNKQGRGQKNQNEFVKGIKVKLKFGLIDTQNQCLSTNKYGTITQIEGEYIFVSCGKDKKGKDKTGKYLADELEIYDELQPVPAPKKPLVVNPALVAQPLIPEVKPTPTLVAQPLIPAPTLVLPTPAVFTPTPATPAVVSQSPSVPAVVSQSPSVPAVVSQSPSVQAVVVQAPSVFTPTPSIVSPTSTTSAKPSTKPASQKLETVMVEPVTQKRYDISSKIDNLKVQIDEKNNIEDNKKIEARKTEIFNLCDEIKQYIFIITGTNYAICDNKTKKIYLFSSSIKGINHLVYTKPITNNKNIYLFSGNSDDILINNEIEYTIILQNLKTFKKVSLDNFLTLLGDELPQYELKRDLIPKNKYCYI
jgi:hypothetical protein